MNADELKLTNERQESKSLPHRKEHLERLAFKMSFYEGYHTKIFDFIDGYLGELQDDSSVVKRYPHWPVVLFRMDRRNYSVTEYKDESSMGLLFEPVEPKDPYVAKTMITEPRKDEGIGLWSWCHSIVDKNVQTNNTLEAWRINHVLAEKLAAAGPSQDTMFSAPGTLAYIGTSYYWDVLTAEERNWCINQILTISEFVYQDAVNRGHNALWESRYAIFDKKYVLIGLEVLISKELEEKVRKEVDESLVKQLLSLSFADGNEKPLFETLSRALWTSRSELAVQLFRHFISQATKSRSEASDDHAEKVLFSNYNQVEFLDGIDNYERWELDRALMLVSAGRNLDVEVLSFIQKYLDLYVRDTFRKKLSRRGWEYEDNSYFEEKRHLQQKLGPLLLQALELNQADQLFRKLIGYVLVEELPDFITDKTAEFIDESLQQIIRFQDTETSTERFNFLWNVLEEQTWRSKRVPFLNALMLDFPWKDVAVTWGAVAAAPKSYARKLQLGQYRPESAIKLVAGIGFEPLFPDSITICHSLIADSENKSWLTSYNAEKFVQRAFFLQGRMILKDTKLRLEFLDILNTMVRSGSAIAYIIRESITSTTHSQE